MITSLSNYVRSLDPGGNPPNHASYSGARETLRGKLVREMMRRGLWSASPLFLGFTGSSRWTPDLLDELVSDCYEEIFLHRLRMLRNQLLVRPDIEGLLTRCVRNFLHDLRRESDPLGYQLYTILDASLNRLRELGVLRFEPNAQAKTHRVHNQTLCVFSPETTAPTPSPLTLEETVGRWSSELWPAIFEAQGRARRKVFSQLDEMISRLPQVGITSFLFKNLIDPMKSDLRHRWRNELTRQANLRIKEASTEEAFAFEKLRDCVQQGLAAESAKDRTDLQRLWDLLWTYAAGKNNDKVAEKADRSGQPPTELGLAKALDIPRYRVSTHKATLGRWVEYCQSARAGQSHTKGSPVGKALMGAEETLPPTSATLNPAKEQHPMAPENRRESLRLASALMERSETSAGSAATPLAQLRSGDILVLPVSTDLLVEWVVVDLSRDHETVLLVSGDSRPMIGSYDLKLDPIVQEGMTAVRCWPGASVEARTLDVRWRVGELPTEVMEQIRQKRAEIDRGDLAPSVEEIEVDEDLDYQTWRSETAEIPRLLRETVSRQEIPEERRGNPETSEDPGSSANGKPFGSVWLWPAAASALLTLGLSLSVGWMYHQREMANLKTSLRSRPPQVTSNVALALLRPQSFRGEMSRLEIPADATFIHLVLPVGATPQGTSFELQILRNGSGIGTQGSSTQEIWQGNDLRPSPRGEVTILVARDLLPDGEYQIHLIPTSTPEPRMLVEVLLSTAPPRASIDSSQGAAP